MGAFIVWLLLTMWCISDESRISYRVRKQVEREHNELLTAIERGATNEYYSHRH